jgi:hypothetical protein
VSSSPPKLSRDFGFERFALSLSFEASVIGDTSAPCEVNSDEVSLVSGDFCLARWLGLGFDRLKMTGPSDIAVEVQVIDSRIFITIFRVVSQQCPLSLQDPVPDPVRVPEHP